MKNSTLERYRLLERIAVGASAEVFRAENARGQIVALKRILPQRSEDPRFRRAFAEEAALIQTIDHANVIRLLDFGEMNGTPFIALEYVEGADLSALMGGVAPRLAAFVALRVCRALDAVHSCRDRNGKPLHIVHRDVSPQNILVSERGEVKLTDFGIAKSLLRDRSTQDGSIRGKFDYLAPEQAEPGSPVDARADLFALGAVLHHLLFGRPPFSGANDVETLDRLRRGELVLGALAPEHHPLVDLVGRCLSHRVEDRPASARELEVELEAYCSHHSLEAGDVGRWVRERRGARAPLDADDVAQELLGFANVEVRDTELIAMPPDPTPQKARALIKLLLAATIAAAALGAVLAFRAPDPVLPQVAVAIAPIAPIVPPDPVTPDPRSQRASLAEPAPVELKPVVRARREFGQISINSIPWARVYVDGRFIGETPIRNRRVAAGSRVVELRAAGGRRMQRFVAAVRKGETQVHSFDGTVP